MFQKLVLHLAFGLIATYVFKIFFFDGKKVAKMTFDYPKPRKDEKVVEDFHGTKVADPYRWMEDPDAEETKAFVEAQNKITIPYLESCPIKQKIKVRTTEMWDYAKYGCPRKQGPRYFYYHNTGLQNQSVLFVQDALDGEARVFLDPNKLSEDGTTAIRGSAYSEDGKYFAYGLSKAGSDWVTIHFKDIEKEVDLDDTLENVKFSSMAWTHDNKGIFYNRYLPNGNKSDGTETEANLNQKLYYHRLGELQDKDTLVAEWPEEPKWMTGAEVSDCGRYLIITISAGCDPVNRLYFCDLHVLPQGISDLLPFEKIVDNFDAEYEYITNEGTLFTFKTNLEAPRYKLINIDFSNYKQENWKGLVDQHEKDVLEWAAIVNQNKLILCYLHDVKNELLVADLATGKTLTKLPLDIGSVVGYSGHKKDKEIFYQFMSFVTPGVIYHCDVTTDSYKPEVFRQIKVEGFDSSTLQQDQVFYTSKDGTKIPMFIVHKKGLQLDGNNPVLLYGYGGFNIPITPTFSVSRVMMMQHLGGVLAVANIRGGGEYGETWHKAGSFGSKQNVFDDFHAAAEFLIQHKYTTPKRIAINGGSNGGLLVAACANQRPDLYGVIIDQVGVHDMLRFHKFTIGHAWTTDFGCADEKDHFDFLIKYSPLHNVPTDVNYPSMLMLTADHDDRVVPLHSLKLIATLQEKLGSHEKQENPILIRVDTKAGHGAGKPTAKVIEEVSEIYSFIVLNMNLKWKD